MYHNNNFFTYRKCEHLEEIEAAVIKISFKAQPKTMIFEAKPFPLRHGLYQNIRKRATRVLLDR